MSDSNDCTVSGLGMKPDMPMLPEAPAIRRSSRLGQWTLGMALSAPAWAFADVAVPETKRDKGNAGYSLDFLRDGGNIDLSAFLNGGNVLPGSYRADIFVNGELSSRQEVVFAKDEKTGLVAPCVTADMLENGSVDMTRLDLAGAGGCLAMAELIEHSTVEYNSERLQLHIGVPQAFLVRGARGYVSPSLWDQGVPAGFVNYNFNLRRQGSDDDARQSNYLGLQNGLNLGLWRLRNESSVSQGDGQSTRFTSNRTYAERDITALKSQLSLGETYDNTDTFDSVRFRGFSLRSDEAMWADSDRGYAPVVHGVAESNATVEIRQNGYVLVRTNVTPGPFEISDVSPSGSNGDLEVTVIEADGRRRVSTQAFASLPRMIREGKFRYTLTGGQYHGVGETGGIRPMLASGTLAYGLSSDVTVYGGAQWAESFTASSLGFSRNTPIGAISFDATQSSSVAHGQSNAGQSYRLLYSKTLALTGTTFTLASYRFSTNGYRTLSDHVRDLQTEQDVIGRARSRFDLTVNQRLGHEEGAIYLTAGQQRFWNRAGQSQQIQAGYSNLWGRMNYNLSLSHSRSPQGESRTPDDTRMTLTLSMPLGKDTNHRVSSTTVAQRDGGYSQQNGLNGFIPGWEDTSYTVQAGYDSNSGATSAASFERRTSMASLDASYSVGSGYNNTNLGLSGSLVAHPGGVNFGQPVGETFALVNVQGIENAEVASHTRVSTGANGFAVLPSVTPYRVNHVSLDTRDLGADIELEQTSVRVVPRRGSVTVARFQAEQGHRVEFEIKKADGTRMPFGAVVSDDEGKPLGVTDPSGKSLVLVLKPQGVLTVAHGEGNCRFRYEIAEKAAGIFYTNQQAVCGK
jgi:outer membrane usher protein